MGRVHPDGKPRDAPRARRALLGRVQLGVEAGGRAQDLERRQLVPGHDPRMPILRGRGGTVSVGGAAAAADAAGGLSLPVAQLIRGRDERFALVFVVVVLFNVHLAVVTIIITPGRRVHVGGGLGFGVVVPGRRNVQCVRVNWSKGRCHSGFMESLKAVWQQNVLQGGKKQLRFLSQLSIGSNNSLRR